MSRLRAVGAALSLFAAAGIVAAFLLPADWWAPLLWVGALLCVFVAVGWVAVTPQLGEALAVEVVTRLVAITAATPEDAT